MRNARMQHIRRMQKLLLQAFDGQPLDGLKFCFQVYELFEQVRSTPQGIEAIRMRRGKCKKLVEELLPICKFVQTKYRPGRHIAVTWRDGNQTYDAELTSVGAYVTNGHYSRVSFIEVTCVVHPNDYLAREHLNAGGAVFGLDGLERTADRCINSTPQVHIGDQFILDYADLVLREVTKKAAKPYPENTSLVVRCALNRPYVPSEWTRLIALLSEQMVQHPFTELFLYDPVSEYSASI